MVNNISNHNSFGNPTYTLTTDAIRKSLIIIGLLYVSLNFQPKMTFESHSVKRVWQIIKLQFYVIKGLFWSLKVRYLLRSFLVPKHDGSIRRWIDYRCINEVTKKDVYPIPRIDERLDTLNKSKYCIVFDMCPGYHHVPVKKSDEEKIAFSYFGGHFIPFGLW